MSPATARRLGYGMPDKAEGHGPMMVAGRSAAPIHGWTTDVQVRPPTHLTASDGSRKLITALSYMRCQVADISEDTIMGFDYILPLQGGFTTDHTENCFRLATFSSPCAPTVNIPLVGQTEATSVTHHTLDHGPQGPAIDTSHSDLGPPSPLPGETSHSTPLTGQPIVLRGPSTVALPPRTNEKPSICCNMHGTTLTWSLKLSGSCKIPWHRNLCCFQKQSRSMTPPCRSH